MIRVRSSSAERPAATRPLHPAHPIGEDRMSRDLPGLVSQLELDEKAALLAGADLWSTVAVERLDIPPVRVTDGPNGARGPELPGLRSGGLTSVCVPCGAALGATWDVDMLERVGAVLGRETRTKASRVLLAPTVNLHRSPLGGRNFESYSEDPLLAGRMAAGFVRGAQSEGVACTVKHFAGNESEDDRMVADTIVDERTLREIHLLPFELAVREGGALGIMTSYNRLNGEYCADRHDLLAGVLRGEWGFDGFVVSDWFAFAETGKAIAAGLDLEMPGPGRAYGPALAAAVREGRVDEMLVDAAVLRLLGVFDRIGALDDDPTVVPTAEDRPEHRAVAREAAIAGTVLMRNEGGVLPLDPSTLRRVAVIGPNADRAQIMGGGSANLPAHYLRSPLEALRARLGPGVEVVHEAALDIGLTTPEVPGAWLTSEGHPGMTVEFFAPDDLGGVLLHTARAESGSVVWFGRPPAEAGRSFAWRASAQLRVDWPDRWTVSLVQTEPARLLVDGEVVLDGLDRELPRGHDFMGMARRELTTVLELSPDRPVRIELQSAVRGRSLVTGAKLGLRPAPAADGLERAVALAAEADAAVVVVGTDADWESEGSDRTSMHLPGEQDELVARVLDVAPDAVVVLNTGAPVAAPWAGAARALLQIWFGGQEMADGLVDVLLGEAEPGGRLPSTVPARLEDNPSWGNFPAEGGRIRYGEGVLVGYRWYESRRMDVSFPFGHGLSYTTFEIGVPELSSDAFEPGRPLGLRVPVTNVGGRPGTEVVQLYVAPARPRAFRPPKELKAFAKVALDPGQSTVVDLELDGRAFARWADPDPALGRLVPRLEAEVAWARPPASGDERGWVVDPGPHHLHVGRSSADIAHVVTIDVPTGWPHGAGGG
jgi:beta-glucosidase